MSNINIMALGGLDEKTKSLYTIEIDSKIFILDSGIEEPLNSTFGIKRFVPKIEYLLENRDKIKGIFLSSANFEQLGSLDNIFKNLPNIKIYGSSYTLKSLKIFFPNIDFSKNIVPIKSGEKVDFSNVIVSPIELTSSIPGNFGYVFKTENGNIIYLVDYTFDTIEEYGLKLLSNINKVSEQDNLIFITDSSNMNIKTSLFPNFRIESQLNKFINKEKRTFVFLYESDLLNIVEVINAAKEKGKKIYFESEEMIALIKNMIDEKYIDDFSFNNLKELKPVDYDQNNILVIYSGRRAKFYKKISSLLTSEDIGSMINKNDVIYIGSIPQPGNEDYFQKIISEFSKIDCEIYFSSMSDKYNISPSQFDLKNFTQLLNPKYVIPVKAYFKEMNKARDVVVKQGIDSNNVPLMKNGQIANFKDGKLVTVENFTKSVGFEIVDFSNEKSIDNKIIEDRMMLSKDGILIIGAIINQQTRTIISNIDVQMRGVIFVKNQNKLISQIQNIVVEIAKNTKPNDQINKIISQVNKNVTKLLREEIKKIPLIDMKIRYM